MKNSLTCILLVIIVVAVGGQELYTGTSPTLLADQASFEIDTVITDTLYTWNVKSRDTVDVGAIDTSQYHWNVVNYISGNSSVHTTAYDTVNGDIMMIYMTFDGPDTIVRCIRELEYLVVVDTLWRRKE